MSLLRSFHPDVRLKRLLAEGGGITASEALRRAEEGLESVRAHCLAAVDQKIDAVASAPADRAGLDRCYVLANEIFAEAGAFDLKELSAVALNLCQLLATRDGTRAFPAQAIAVHVDAMRALRAPTASASKAARAAVLAELQRLSARLAR